MKLIVRDEKYTAPEPYEKRTARIIAQEGMESWSDEQIAAVATDFTDERQQAAHLVKRQRSNEKYGQSAKNPGPAETKWMWTR